MAQGVPLCTGQVTQLLKTCQQIVFKWQMLQQNMLNSMVKSFIKIFKKLGTQCQMPITRDLLRVSSLQDTAHDMKI